MPFKLPFSMEKTAVVLRLLKNCFKKPVLKINYLRMRGRWRSKCRNREKN